MDGSSDFGGGEEDGETLDAVEVDSTLPANRSAAVSLSIAGTQQQTGESRLTRWKTRAEVFNLLITSIAIILAGGWAIYTFIFKEIRVPRSELGHLSGRADLRIVAAKDSYRAIQASVYIKNNSRKAVKLLPSLVMAVGYRFVGDILTGPIEDVPWRTLKSAFRPVMTRYDTRRDTKVLMATDPIRDIDLGAGEERTDTVIFHVDARYCDYMDLFVQSPFVYNDLDLDAEWDIVGGNSEPTYYKITNGMRHKLSDAEKDKLLVAKTFDVLRVRSSLSLWPDLTGKEIKGSSTPVNPSTAISSGKSPSQEGGSK